MSGYADSMGDLGGELTSSSPLASLSVRGRMSEKTEEREKGEFNLEKTVRHG